MKGENGKWVVFDRYGYRIGESKEEEGKYDALLRLSGMARDANPDYSTCHVRWVEDNVFEVAYRFLHRKATIGELRAAVKAAKGESYSPKEIDDMEADIASRGE